MKTVKQRFSSLLWENKLVDIETAEKWYIALAESDIPGTLYWKDIDYANQDRSFWAAAQHYQRIERILTAFGKERLMNDAQYARNMTVALKYWLINDFENPNWWHNEIGMPQRIGNIALLMEPILDEVTLSTAAQLVSKGSMAQNEHARSLWTGANLIWGMLNTIRHALLINDEQLLMTAARRAASEITIDLHEGIQEDYSFFQHGVQLYSGGYGRSFAYDVSQILFLLHGTQYQFPEKQVDIFLSFILDGLQHMTQCGTLDWGCVGRELSRMNALKAGIIVKSVWFLINTAGLPRKQELLDFYDCLKGAPHPDMTKYFNKAAMLCHHFDGIYVGAKFMNNRIYGAEICNGEGELCYNMSYGTHTCIMRNGNEYCNINPVWDYSRIPGTTSRIETDEQLLSHRKWWERPLPNDHAGGKQNGCRAVIYELAEHGDIKTLAADFAFEHGFVCLGTEIQGENVNTTVDQCLLQGDVITENNCIIHNGIRYSPLDNTQIDTVIQTQQGSWHRNSIALSDEPIRMDVLTLSINHSENDRCRYAYMISSADKEAPNVEVIRNDGDVQAIRLPDGDIMAVFHHTSILTADGQEILGNAGTILC